MAKKEMIDDKSGKVKPIDRSSVSYTLGVLSIVFGILIPLAGFVIGVVGWIISGKQSDELSARAKKLNMIGVVISIIAFILGLIVAYYLNANLQSLLAPQ
jgi:ABC-type Mn2+/Zn2+ transport system permease subunit